MLSILWGSEGDFGISGKKLKFREVTVRKSKSQLKSLETHNSRSSSLSSTLFQVFISSEIWLYRYSKILFQKTNIGWSIRAYVWLKHISARQNNRRGWMSCLSISKEGTCQNSSGGGAMPGNWPPTSRCHGSYGSLAVLSDARLSKGLNCTSLCSPGKAWPSSEVKDGAHSEECNLAET